jgi:flavin reductase (DIM6/NTAB) family NADH-FMN oxidoreductase RutF
MSLQFEKIFAETIGKLKNPGLLLVSSNKHGKSNVMTIGWALIGIFFGKPVFMVSIQASSKTCEFIEDSGEFTVNVPEDDMNETVEYCGTVSGREHDKFSECSLDLLKSRIIHVPIIAQCKWHYECKVMNELEVMPKSSAIKSLTHMLISKSKGLSNNFGDNRILYFGEILAVY